PRWLVKRRSDSSNVESEIVGLYEERIVPWLIHLSMRQSRLAPYRGRVVSTAIGRVLEVGIGSGLNLPFYGRNVKQVVGLEPSPKLLDMALKAARQAQIPLRLVEGTAETTPIQDRSIDTVVTTWTMCSIPDVERALLEMRRVLVPSTRSVDWLHRAWVCSPSY